MPSKPTIDTVRGLGEKYCNWGRWGGNDELGTLNHVTAGDVVQAAGLVRSGRIVQMGLPIDDAGPQSGGGGFGRFNPIHLMIRDGADIVAGTTIRDFYGGNDRHLRGTDDVLIMALQSGTQWDALAHIFFEGSMYNGYAADQVSSKGALKNDVTAGCGRMIGRGVLLDVPAALGVPWLEPGTAITSKDLERCEQVQGVAVGRGDFVFVRTGQLVQVRDRGSWGDYDGGPAPGLGLDAVPWVAGRQIAALATDSADGASEAMDPTAPVTRSSADGDSPDPLLLRFGPSVHGTRISRSSGSGVIERMVRRWADTPSSNEWWILV